jgi:hypothetical protein
VNQESVTYRRERKTGRFIRETLDGTVGFACCGAFPKNLNKYTEAVAFAEVIEFLA